jgi:prepilin-type N-terminal cleavage/methylation domain-containing protein
MSKKFLAFTLIELLVVIAIIGILSSVVFASLNSARGKAADSNIKENLSGIRAAAEIFYDAGGSYGNAFTLGACAATANTLFADPTISGQITAAGNASSNGGIGAGSCVSTPTAWAVSVPLKVTSTNSWCVDSTGASRQVTPAGSDRGFNGTACK